ncbi:MAG: hypothetical protein VST70_05075 [Nitrospirota bacterium]|nr:hypothetical protein [Nitrospirota bacterium]
MKSLSAKKGKTMSGNAIRQARYAEKMRAMGLKKLTLWVTPEEEQFIRACILDPQRLQRERENP